MWLLLKITTEAEQVPNLKPCLWSYTYRWEGYTSECSYLCLTMHEFNTCSRWQFLFKGSWMRLSMLGRERTSCGKWWGSRQASMMMIILRLIMTMQYLTWKGHWMVAILATELWRIVPQWALDASHWTAPACSTKEGNQLQQTITERMIYHTCLIMVVITPSS